MQKKLFHLYLKVNLYSKLYTMTQKTKILTLSLVSVAGLAAFTVFASNNTSLLDFKGEVKQNINLELKQLNLMPDITQKNNGGAAGISWKIVWDTLTTVDPRAKDAPNTVTKQGKFSFGGHGNITNAAESLILAGEKNNLSANTSIVGASKKIVGNQGEGNTVLSSSDITFTGDNHIINSSAHTQVNGTGNIVFSSEDVAINTIGSMAVGKKIRITHPGSFIFNGTDRDVASNKEYTTKIMADKGMIINTNSQKADGVDLTINGGLKVSHNTTDNAWAIISEARCLKIKGVNKGEIWFWCSTTPETPISTPKCGKNAADYPATASAWKESSDKGFCENGTLSPSTRPTFWTDAEKAAAKSNGSYASAGFGNYSFTICFVEGDPFCKASGAKKTWRCTTQEGNAMTCEATIAAEPKKCKANEHLEGTTCVANTKQVACDNTNISSSANGTVSNNQVTITRSNGRWSAPEKCTLNCNAGYEKKTDPATHRESCEKKETYQCQGIIPENSEIIAWDDEWLTENTPVKLVNNNSSAKCEYKCKEGYINVNNTECYKSKKLAIALYPIEDMYSIEDKCKIDTSDNSFMFPNIHQRKPVNWFSPHNKVWRSDKYSNDKNYFCTHGTLRISTEGYSAYVKEVKTRGKTILYLYTNEEWTKKLPSGLYLISAASQLRHENSQNFLFKFKITWVYVDNNGAITKWIANKKPTNS